MNKIYLLLLSLVSLTANSQFQFHAGYSLAAPRQEMANNINLLHSFTMGGSATIPGTAGRLQGGLDLTWGMYANTTKEQTFTFSNGSTTRTDVNYSSNVLQLALTSKLMAFRNAVINPYISGKGGFANFYSNIFIEDPHDPNGCRALDQDNLIRDGAFIAGYGGGLQIDASLFSKRLFKGTNFIDISISKNSGSNIDYINMKKLYDAGDPATTPGTKPLNVKFINASTQQIHEHQVAEVYNTPIRFLEFKITGVFKLDPPSARKGKSSRSCSSPCRK